MDLVDHASQGSELWREGVETFMRISALTGSHQICIFEQFCAPGLGAPVHVHVVEEVLEVMEGLAEITVSDQARIVSPNQSVVIPAGMRHGFRNVGEGLLRVRATIASSIFEAAYDDRREQSRRYMPG